MTRRAPVPRRGMTLIEVLIALLLLSFGLMGMIGLKAVGLKQGAQSQSRSVATAGAIDIVDRMRANPVRAMAGAYNIALTDPAPTTPANVVQTDLQRWRQRLSQSLPAGVGSVAVQADGRVRVVVQWAERQETSSTPATLQFTFDGRL
jgi:type IV pilus assembly protein PilV